MKRRQLIRLLSSAALAWPLAARSQQARLPTIGVLLVGNLEPFWSQFREGLRDFGYVDGQNIRIEFRSGEGKLGILPDLAADLVRLKVDLIVASETPAVQAAKQATNTIPIVMAPSGDPVGTGQVASLAKPGGNVTGLSAATAELAGKSLELLRELLPPVHRVAALADPTNPFTKPFLEQIKLAGQALSIEIDVHMVRSVDEFEAAFAAMTGARVDAVIVQPTLPRKRAVELVLQHRLPAVSGNRAFADAGGLMSYAASLADRYREAAVYVDKILKGRNPGDLPVQQPTKFELVVNLKTATALGLTIPPNLLLRADELIK
jgi:putative tryptophan/tyrosine transport system substrate-binding protein